MSHIPSAARQTFVLLTFSLVCLLGGGVFGAVTIGSTRQDTPQSEKQKSERRDKKVALELSDLRLWEDRGDIAALDLFWGPGGPDKAPQPPFTFEKEDMSGSNPKILVVDSNGVKWSVKFDEEVHAEIAASRIVWACGYMVDENYFVASGRVEGAKGLVRAKSFISSDGSFSKARFERRPESAVSLKDNWYWETNYFFGKKEFSGLVILMAMLNNWDTKTSNNKIVRVIEADGARVKEWYYISDLGGTFGKMGGVFSHTKWDLDAFRRQAFIDEVSKDSIKLHYRGKMSRQLTIIPIEHARWFSGIVGQLTDAQLKAAFKAAGASEDEIEGFSARLGEKINELKQAAEQSAAGISGSE